MVWVSKSVKRALQLALSAVSGGGLFCGASELHAAETLSWTCYVSDPVGSALLKGPILIGIGTGAARREARAMMPLIHILNNARPVIATVRAQTSDKIEMEWDVDNTGQRADVPFSRVSYVIKLDRHSGDFSVQTQAEGYDGQLSATGQCDPREV